MLVFIQELEPLSKGVLPTSLQFRAKQTLDKYETFGLDLPLTDCNLTTTDAVEAWSHSNVDVSAQDVIDSVDWEQVAAAMKLAGMRIVVEIIERL